MNLTGAMNNEEENLINKIVYLMQRDKSVDAPEDSVRWAKNLFRAKAAQEKPSLVQKVLAVLQVNLSPQSAAFGERSASAARQMLFGADKNLVDLRIVKGERGMALTGQILGEDFAGAEIKLSCADSLFTTRANKLSEFKFESIPEGKYILALIKDDKEIIIENLDID
jgi:hypothetical protein